MGANAQTTVPTFTSGQVLTADQQNQSARTGVPVFATTVERDAAFGGTGEKTLAEGQLCYLESTNVVQYYDGAAWATVGPSTPGLVCVKAETAFSAASSVTADNVFTSTYTNYVVQIRLSTSTTNLTYFKLRASGTSASTNYDVQTLTANDTGVSGARLTAQTSAIFGYYTNSASEKYGTTLHLMGPQLAEPTAFHSEASGTVGSNAALSYYVGGNHRTATAYDGIELLVATGNMTGTYAIYGYSKTV